MNTMSQDLQLSSFLDDNQDSLYKQWQEELSENPHFSETQFSNQDSIGDHSKALLDQLIKTISHTKIPDISKTIDPLFSLWKDIRKTHTKLGLNTKDTALFLLSFKTCLANYLKEQGTFQYRKEITDLNNLLDFLGLLTFESYSTENERLLGIKEGQISYLQENKDLPSEILSENVIGKSPAILQVYKALGVVVDNTISVLLEGESGTGKDLIASIIHYHSKRKSGPFITLNCGAIPKELVESALFGHEKGAFTGADAQKLGKFELADGGTLFLDEIGELPLAVQVKLLRVLQNKEVERVGGTQKHPINVRIIAASNKKLEEEVAQNRFRLDLFYRLNIFPIRIPPLRDRLEDIPDLAQFFIDKYAEEFQLAPPQLTDSAISTLQTQSWPGNIRELENLMQRMVVLASGQSISPEMLHFQPGHSAKQLSNDSQAEQTHHTKDAQHPQQDPHPLFQKGQVSSLKEVEKHSIIHALENCQYNIQKTAKALGISRTTLYNKAKRYEIDIDHQK